MSISYKVFDARFSHDEASLFTAGADSLVSFVVLQLHLISFQLRKWDARGQLIQQWTSGTSVDTASRYPGLNALAFDVDDECLIRCFSPESKAALSEQATVFEVRVIGSRRRVPDTVYSLARTDSLSQYCAWKATLGLFRALIGVKRRKQHSPVVLVVLSVSTDYSKLVNFDLRLFLFKNHLKH